MIAVLLGTGLLLGIALGIALGGIAARQPSGVDTHLHQLLRGSGSACCTVQSMAALPWMLACHASGAAGISPKHCEYGPGSIQCRSDCLVQ